MASYTKTFNLIFKDYYGNIIGDDYIIPYNNYATQGYGYFNANRNEIPFLKTLKQIKINVYCMEEGESNPVLMFEFLYDLEHAHRPHESHVPLNGWNEIAIAGDDLQWGKEYGDPLIRIKKEAHMPSTRNTRMYIHNSNYKPYVTITYEDTPPDAPSSLYPDNITVNARNIIRFSWAHNSREELTQKGFVLEYSIDAGNTWVSVSETTTNEYCDIPANTLPVTGAILWRVKTIDGNNIESGFSSNVKFNTELVPQKPPILISPVNGYVDASSEIVLKWSFQGGTAEDEQGKYDLQYSLDSGLSWTTLTTESSSQECILPANTFQSGNIYWRVRTYTIYGDVSPYSEIANFYVMARPPIPQIRSVSNNAKPVISWISTEQHLYRIQILKNDKVIFDTGAIPSTSDRNYKLDIFLDDGNYTAKLRTMNQYNLYSEWAEYKFTIATEKPKKPDITVFSAGYSAVLKSDSLSGLVYRDNALIGEMADGIYEDYTGENNKEYTYFIRAVDENDNFNDSDKKIGKCKCRCNTLALAKEPKVFIKLKHSLDNRPKKSDSLNVIGSLINFDGREYPVVEFSEFKSMAKTLSFFLRREELNSLIQLIDKREILLYRDIRGENIKGTILTIDYDDNLFGYDINFTITKTSDDYD